MASLRKHIELGADAATAWDALSDFAAVHERVAAGFVTNSVADGDDRIVTFVNGSVARERLVASDDNRRRLVYSVVESSLGVTHHQASVEVVDGSEGAGCRLVWLVDVLPHAAAPSIDAMMTAGAAAIAHTLAGQ